MAANTVSNWTIEKTGNNDMFSAYCTVAVDTANVVAWTNKTPAMLDGTKPWILEVVFSGALDTGATPLDIYIGNNTNAALSGTSSVTASNAAKYMQLLDDCGYTDPTLVKAIYIDPNSALANVVAIASVGSGLKAKVPPAPNYLFNLTAYSGTLLGVTATFRIIQNKKG